MLSPDPPVRQEVEVGRAIREKGLPARENGGYHTCHIPYRKAPFRCVHLATAWTGSEVTFDDERLVANAGLIAPASLAQHLGLRELFDQRVDLGDAPGRANVGHKAMTVIHSVLAAADSIDGCEVLRAGSTVAVLGHEVRAPSTIGTFLRSFSWGHARQLDAVAGEALARAWRAGAGPADPAGPFTIDLDSSIHETYGLQKEGGSRSATPTCVAITRSMPSPATTARCCIPGCGAATPTPPGARSVS